MLFTDSVGNLIEIVKRPKRGDRFDYLWTARLVNDGPGKDMNFSFDSGDIGVEYTPVVLELSA